MTRTIQQTVRYDATARQLYDLYMNPKLHAAFTGSPVKISPRPGNKFEAFDKMLWGTTLCAVPGKMIVQRWRSVNFKKSDEDSILTFYFKPDGRRARIEMAHVNVPQQDHKGVTNGWRKYYWEPMKRFLKEQRRRRGGGKAARHGR